jgi:hypothetical protein
MAKLARNARRDREAVSAKKVTTLERFQAKWKPVRVKKTRQIKNLEPRFDSIEAEKALVAPSLRAKRSNP